jgi:ADP-heptose:LPS heptosyltransferase
MTKTIILQRWGALGDVLNTTPVLRRLRKENPDAFIDVVTAKLAAYRDNPDLTSLCPARPSPYYDQSVILDMAYERNRKVNQVDAFMMEAFGDTGGDKTLFLAHDTAPPPRLPALPWSSVVVMHPNRSWEQRTFAPEWWQAIADKLVLLGFIVVVTGTSIDSTIKGRRIIDTRDKLSLAEQASLIENAACALCGPSGIANLVACTETPLVLICNITRAAYTLNHRHGELGWNSFVVKTPLECYGCAADEPPSEFFKCRRGDNACLTSIPVADVVASVEEAIMNDARHFLSYRSSSYEGF